MSSSDAPVAPTAAAATTAPAADAVNAVGATSSFGDSLRNMTVELGKRTRDCWEKTTTAATEVAALVVKEAKKALLPPPPPPVEMQPLTVAMAPFMAGRHGIAQHIVETLQADLNKHDIVYNEQLRVATQKIANNDLLMQEEIQRHSDQMATIAADRSIVLTNKANLQSNKNANRTPYVNRMNDAIKQQNGVLKEQLGYNNFQLRAPAPDPTLQINNGSAAAAAARPGGELEDGELLDSDDDNVAAGTRV